jgi:hypothetical protein
MLDEFEAKVFEVQEESAGQFKRKSARRRFGTNSKLKVTDTIGPVGSGKRRGTNILSLRTPKPRANRTK